MKNLLSTCLVVLSVTLYAQDFEGVITWSIKTEIKDPKMKAQMEEAQKRMNDPAMQKQMKEMQAQMADPKFKAMMESNPQMKAQMEKMMNMANGGGMESMMPKGMAVKIKNGNTVTIMEGGVLTGEVLYLKEKESTYHIDRDSKTFSVLGGGTNSNEMNATVTKMSGMEKVAGYNCQKYKVDLQEKGKAVTQYVWATNEIKGLDMRGIYNQGIKGNSKPVFYQEIEGVPLKVEMNMPEMNMTMEASEVSKKPLPAGDFVIPSDFKEVKGMFGSN